MVQGSIPVHTLLIIVVSAIRISLFPSLSILFLFPIGLVDPEYRRAIKPLHDSFVSGRVACKRE